MFPLIESYQLHDVFSNMLFTAYYLKFSSLPSYLLSKSPAILLSKILISLDRALPDSGRDNSAHAILQCGGKRPVKDNAGPGTSGTLLETTNALESLVESTDDDLSILLLVVDNTVGAGIEGVGGNCPADLLVDVLNSADGSAGDVVHVEDRRVGVGASSVERVGLAHGDLGELGEVFVLDGLLHKSHVGGDNICDSLLEEAGGSDSLLHSGGRRNTLLGGADNENQSSHLGPVRRGSDEISLGVASVLLLTHPPGDVTAEETSASGSGTLSGNERKVRR